MEIIHVIIIIATCLVSIAAFEKREYFNKLCFDPYGMNVNKDWYRFFTYALLHADWAHLVVNMYVLYSFGSIVEIIFQFHFKGLGILYFILLYVGGTFVSVIPSFLKNKNNPYYTAVGASGAVSAIVFSSILMFPEGSIRFFFIPIDIPSYIFGILYLVYSWYMAKKGKDNIGHDVHFWGALFGFGFTILLKPWFIVNFLNSIF